MAPSEIAPSFHFQIDGLEKDALAVTRWRAEEGLSTPYRYEIEAVSSRTDLDAAAMVGQKARFLVKQGDLFPEESATEAMALIDGAPDPVVHGIVASVEETGRYLDRSFFRIELRPRLWWLGLDRKCAVYLNRSIPEIVTDVLRNARFSEETDYDVRLSPWPAGGGEEVDDRGFRRREYVCQYNESSLDFISRLMEHVGLYYFFEQAEAGELLVVTNTSVQQKPLAPATVAYRPRSGLEAGPCVTQFRGKQAHGPRSVSLLAYNYEKPSLLIQAAQTIGDRGAGDHLLYDENCKSREEAETLGAIRAEALRVASSSFDGESLAPFFRVGYRFGLRDHYRDDPRDGWNRDYLLTTLRHEGAQPVFGADGLGESEETKAASYRNTFTAIPQEVQYRPSCTTPKPSIAGCVTGTVDLDALDDQGRYKIRLPFASAEAEGQASHWIRLAKPYAGGQVGFHFPLRKGTEVLLSFLGGDPDRPVITHAMENADAPSVTNDINIGRLRLPTGSVTEYLSSGGGAATTAGATNTGSSSGSGDDGSLAGALLDKASAARSNALSRLKEKRKARTDAKGEGFAGFSAASDTDVDAPPVELGESTTIAGSELTPEEVESIAVSKVEEYLAAYGQRYMAEVSQQFMDNLVQQVEGDMTQTIQGLVDTTIRSTLTTTVEGVVTETLQSHYNATVAGNYAINAAQNMTLAALGDRIDTIEGALNSSVTGTASYSWNASKSEFVNQDDFKMTAGNDVSIALGASEKVTAGGSAAFTLGLMDVKATLTGLSAGLSLGLLKYDLAMNKAGLMLTKTDAHGVKTSARLTDVRAHGSIAKAVAAEAEATAAKARAVETEAALRELDAAVVALDAAVADLQVVI